MALLVESLDMGLREPIAEKLEVESSLINMVLSDCATCRPVVENGGVL